MPQALRISYLLWSQKGHARVVEKQSACVNSVARLEGDQLSRQKPNTHLAKLREELLCVRQRACPACIVLLVLQYQSWPLVLASTYCLAGLPSCCQSCWLFVQAFVPSKAQDS